MKISIYGLIIIVTFLLPGCDKKSTLPQHYIIIPPGNTNVKFLQMSPDAPQVNFIVNGSKVTAVPPTATNAVQGLAFPSFYPATVGYATFASGAAKIDAKVPDSSTVTPGAIIFTGTQTFEANKYYTYALVDSIKRLNALVVEDDPRIPDPAKAYFRVANLIPNGNVKIEIIKTSTGNPYSITYPNVAFKSFSPFDTLGAGAGQIYRVFLRNRQTDVKLDSIAAFTPSNTKKYTIYARGVLGLTGTNVRRPIISVYTNF